METIKDLFIEEQSYIVEHKLNDKYYLWIEAFHEYGNAQRFDERILLGNVLVELHSYDFDDSICEWDYEDFNVDTTVEYLEKVMKFAIELYESDQGDEE